MSQNRQEAKDRKRAENDYRVNLKSEFVIDELYRKLEQVSENQKKILKLLEKPSDTDKNDDWSSIFISRKTRKYRRLLIGFNSAMNN